MANLDRRRLTLLLATAAAVVLAAYLAVRWLAHPTMIDMVVYRREGRAVLNGEDLYGAGVQVASHGGNVLPATYPPFAAMLFAPLAWLPVGAAKVLVTAANIGLVAVVVHLSLELVEWRPVRAERWAVVAAVSALCLWLEPVWTTLRYGQTLLVGVNEDAYRSVLGK